MKQLLIIGARGFGREVYNMAHECHGFGETFVIKGFLDDKVDALDGYAGYAPIIDSVEHYIPQPDDVFVCALGDVRHRRKYTEMVQANGGKFINLIHNTVCIARNTTIGQGCIILPHVGISCDITIGDFVTIHDYTIIGHDVKIGNYCQLGARVFMGGYVEIKDDVTLYTAAIIHPHKTVESGATVGAGSVVIRNVKMGTTVMGNPAKKIEY